MRAGEADIHDVGELADRCRRRAPFLPGGTGWSGHHPRPGTVDAMAHAPRIASRVWLAIISSSLVGTA
jgi:hypothetical protein